MAKGDTAAIPSTEQHGVVVKWDAEKGYGFIRPDGTKGTTDQDVFVHVRNVEGRRNLTPGQGASYHLTRTDKGLAAINVRPGSAGCATQPASSHATDRT
jgi:CspA family cold shock protein